MRVASDLWLSLLAEPVAEPVTEPVVESEVSEGFYLGSSGNVSYKGCDQGQRSSWCPDTETWKAVS